MICGCRASEMKGQPSLWPRHSTFRDEPCGESANGDFTTSTCLAEEPSPLNYAAKVTSFIFPCWLSLIQLWHVIRQTSDLRIVRRVAGGTSARACRRYSVELLCLSELFDFVP